MPATAQTPAPTFHHSLCPCCVGTAALTEIETQKRAAIEAGADNKKIEILEFIESLLVDVAGIPMFGVDDEDDLFDRVVKKMTRDAKSIGGVPMLPSRGSTEFHYMDGGRTALIHVSNVNGVIGSYTATIGKGGRISVVAA